MSGAKLSLPDLSSWREYGRFYVTGLIAQARTQLQFNVNTEMHEVFKNV
jgi:hypothetical protein